jgi:glycosyltransferase involved in cell wall biosynthesis
MRICLICVEIFAWGKYGGFGRATRTIGRELAERGHEVIAVVPRRDGQGAVEQLDGMTVLSFPPRSWLASVQLLKQANAQIYHSCEPSLGTYFAQRAMPDRVHIVTCRDPRDWEDWKTEFELPSRSRLRVVVNYVYENSPLVRRGVQRADVVYTAAKCLILKAQAMYRLKTPPVFLPTPIPIPSEVTKAPTPTVCFVGRLDRRKRPELFLELAKRMPDVRFIAVGASNDRAWDAELHRRYGGLPNLDMRGFVDQFKGDELSRILGSSWIIMNTSAREGLPNSMLEAAAHRCAVLSSVDPDDFATSFGVHVQDDDFEGGLRRLLENDAWRERGLAAWRYVGDTFATEPAIRGHLAAYEGLLRRRAARDGR